MRLGVARRRCSARHALTLRTGHVDRKMGYLSRIERATIPIVYELDQRRAEEVAVLG